MPIDGFTYPVELGEKLVERFGPYQEHVSEYSYLLGWTDYETCLEEAEYQAQWFAKATLYLAKEKEVSLFYSHWHFLDDINHHHLANIDPSWDKYDPEDAERHKEIIRKAYRIVDRYVGALLDNKNEDDYLIIISDHGNIPVNRRIWIEKLLSDKGFLIRKNESLPLSVLDEQWEENIDWEKTKVFLRGGSTIDFSIYVNAEGDKKNEIQDELIKELRTWVDEETGKTPIAIALKKRDAAILGLWGDNVGDIIIVTDPDYTITMLAGTPHASNKKVSSKTWTFPMAGITNSCHGTQLLTCQSETSSHLGMFVIIGPRIKKGYERPPEKLGYIRMKDVAPTICHILNISPPSQSQGAVLYDIFEDNEMIRNLPTDLVEDKKLDERLILQKGMHDYSIVEVSEKHYLETLRKVGWSPHRWRLESKRSRERKRAHANST
jgi:predicted AlkP superfamily phosphohydrolase/phosphomutase